MGRVKNEGFEQGSTGGGGRGVFGVNREVTGLAERVVPAAG